jgi:tetratricopeptide (TPR) repeat protein
MLGRFDEARAIFSELTSELRARGAGILLANVIGLAWVPTELSAGDPAAAAALGEEACGLYEAFGERAYASTAMGLLAQALYALDRLGDADAWAARAAELGASDDATTQITWRQVRSKVLARRGEHGKAERLARRAVDIAENTDALNWQGDALCDLAEVLQAAGRSAEAAGALQEALERYQRKENLGMAEQTRERLESLLQLGSQ